MQIKRWLSFCLGLNVMLAIQTQLQPQPRSQSVQSRVWVSMIHLSAIGMSLEGVSACFFVGRSNHRKLPIGQIPGRSNPVSLRYLQAHLTDLQRSFQPKTTRQSTTLIMEYFPKK